MQQILQRALDKGINDRGPDQALEAFVSRRRLKVDCRGKLRICEVEVEIEVVETLFN